MTIYDLVTPLDLARKLKDLGVEQKSLFYWKTAQNINPQLFQDDKPVMAVPKGDGAIECEVFSAYTAGELGELMKVVQPPNEYDDFPLMVYTAYTTPECWASFLYDQQGNTKFESSGDTEVEAKARMMIHLVSHKIMIL